MAGASRWRPVLLRLHRWIALSAGLVLLLNAVSGLVLLGGRGLDRALHPELFSVQPQASRVTLESIRQSLQPQVGTQMLILRPPREPGSPLIADVRGDTGWEGQIFIDPYSGRQLGARDRFDFGLSGLFELHSTLLAGTLGKGALALCALGFGVLLASGLWMWWPMRWRMAFRITLSGGRLRSFFDLHRVGGAVLGIWVLVVSVTTGGILAWRPATVWVNRLAGQTTTEAPKLAPSTARANATVEALLQQSEAALPGGTIGSIQLPSKPTQPVRVRKKVDGDPHPNGLSTLWLDPRSAEVLRVDRWNAFAWVFTLHSGHLGGPIGLVITSVSGAALLGFGVTGVGLWWTRRRARTPSRARLATP